MAAAPGEPRIRILHDGGVCFTVVTRYSVTKMRIDYPHFVRACARSRVTGKFREPVLNIGRVEAASVSREENSGQLLLPFDEPGGAAAAHRLVFAIPDYARAILRRLNAASTVGVLNLLATCEPGRGALELAQSNLALLVSIAYNGFFRVRRTWDPVFARRLVFARRGEILRALGFPNIERALRRVTALACTPDRLLGLRDACRDPRIAKIVRHLPQITAPVIDAISADEVRGLLSFGFLSDLAGLGFRGYRIAPKKLSELVDIHAELAQVSRRPIPPLPRLKSVSDVERLAADLQEKCERERLHRLSGEWPTSPFPSFSDQDGAIAPLRSLSAVVEQGHACQLCLAHDYGWAAAASVGDVYLFDLTVAEERATLALAPDAEVGFRVEELRGIGNIAVSDRLRIWLCDYFRSVIGRDLLARPTCARAIPF